MFDEAGRQRSEDQTSSLEQFKRSWQLTYQYKATGRYRGESWKLRTLQLMEDIEQDAGTPVDPGIMDAKIGGTPRPSLLPYSGDSGANSTTTPTGITPVQSFRQSQGQTYAQPLSSPAPPPPLAPTGFVYALVPVPNSGQSPSPPPMFYSPNMYQPQQPVQQPHHQ